MLLSFFDTLRRYEVPITIGEFLDFLSSLKSPEIFANKENFYFLSRTILVKDEKNFDKFDRATKAFFDGLESFEGMIDALIPDEWIRDSFKKNISEEEIRNIKKFQNLEDLINQFRTRLNEQKKRHQGGSKWIGTGGTSAYGNNGIHPEGIRVGGESTNKKGVKVWEKRNYRNLDGDSVVSTRNMQLALRRLRKFARTGSDDLLDIDSTIKSTAKNAGLLDLKMIPERHNTVKVLIFFDIGGSMDSYVESCEKLFSAVRSEFKNLEFFYFHNFIYESVWRDNQRRFSEVTPTLEIINKYPRDYKVIFVGDASMSPYEIISSGGSVEHWNEEPGEVWMKRILHHYGNVVWVNPVNEDDWNYSQSTMMIKNLLGNQMYPMSINGLESCMTQLSK